MDIKKALKFGFEQLGYNNTNSAQLDAEILFLHALGPASYDKTWLYLHLKDELGYKTLEKFKQSISHRAKGEPVAYITQSKQFYGLDFFVDKRVLIPRPETELLVEQTLKLLTTNSRQLTTVIDIGTGSGAIIISVTKMLKKLTAAKKINKNYFQFIATDISKDALEVAKLNAKQYEIADKIKFLQGDLLKPIIKNFKLEIRNCNLVILANLPYLSEEEFNNEPSIRLEPKQALISEDQGLNHYARLFKQISIVKAKNITLILEHNPHQMPNLHRLISRYLPTASFKTEKDLAGLERITIINQKNN